MNNMKRALILFVAALLAVVGWSQTMTINFKDGSVVNQNVSNINSFEITDTNQSDNGDNQGGDDSQNENPSNGKFTIARKRYNGSELKHEYLYEPEEAYLDDARYEEKHYKTNLDSRFFIWYKGGSIEIIFKFRQYGVSYAATEFKKGFNKFGNESVDINYYPSNNTKTYESEPKSGKVSVIENDGEYITLGFDNYKIVGEKYIEEDDWEELVINGRLSFKIKVEGDYKYDNPCPDDNHPHAIDLGIGTKWSCCNVGAKAPSGCGNTYPWGVTSDEHIYIWNRYRERGYDERWYGYVDNSYWGLENYQYYDESTKQYIYIGNDISGTQYDVAYTKWGENWRMPSENDFLNLFNKCDITVTHLNGTYCYKLKGPNGNIIYLPSGLNDDYTYLLNSKYSPGSPEYAHYWTSTFLYDKYACSAYIRYSGVDSPISTIINRPPQDQGTTRYLGLPVRPIYSK